MSKNNPIIQVDKFQNIDMHLGAGPELFRNAIKLRESMTKAESLLWKNIRNNKLGIKFRRQHPILDYIVDFYCHRIRLVIEIDGEYHNETEQAENDALRTKRLQEFQIKVIRFSNQEVINNMEQVLLKVKQEIIKLNDRQGQAPL